MNDSVINLKACCWFSDLVFHPDSGFSRICLFFSDFKFFSNFADFSNHISGMFALTFSGFFSVFPVFPVFPILIFFLCFTYVDNISEIYSVLFYSSFSCIFPYLFFKCYVYRMHISEIISEICLSVFSQIIHVFFCFTKSCFILKQEKNLAFKAIYFVWITILISSYPEIYQIQLILLIRD